MSEENRLLRTIYDYESTDEKILSVKVGELFIVLKGGTDFTYVVNAYGRLGYIPTNFSEPTTLDDNEYLQFVKNVLSLLESSLTKNPNITKRQINHAQVKLTQLRCELVKKLSKLNPITPDEKKTFILDASQSVENNLEPLNEKDEIRTDEQVKIVRKSKKDVKLKKSSNSELNKDKKSESSVEVLPSQHSIPETLTLDLLEKIRFTTNCNYNVCKLTLKSVLNCLKMQLPNFHDEINLILRQINSCDQNISLEFIKTSTDYLELRSLFNKLWYCKNDEQQRSWPIMEDEEQIKYILSSLSSILKNANPKISKMVLCENNCENINLLITYFQMENRSILKLEIYYVFLQLIKLLPNTIPDIMLPSVLPCALSNELINYKMDTTRWSLASKVFTSIFSTGHRPPINIYDYINEQFINSLLDLVEEPPNDHIQISPESSIPPILAFNLHFQEEDDYNYVINSLRNRSSANHLLENLISYLNWAEDPTQITSILSNELSDKDSNNNFNLELEQLEQLEQNEQEQLDQINKTENAINDQNSNKKTDQTRPNAVHKLLLEIFDDEIISNLFYYNDICVLIDILVTFLNNSNSNDKNRLFYLKLILRISQNTNYKDEPHKLKEILKSLKLVLNDEQSTEEERRLAEIIIELFI